MAREPFDETVARGQVRRVPSAEVIDLLPVSHAPETVARYRASMERGDRFPPVAVLPIGGRLFLSDGHKRLQACRALGVEEIPVEIWTLSRWLADQWRQAKDNARKNRKILSLSISDPRTAGRMALGTLQHWLRVGRSLVSLVRPGSRREDR